MDELARVIECVKSAHKRIDRLEVELQETRKLTEAVIKMTERLEILTKDMDEVKKDVKALSARPAKLWEKVVFTAVGSVVTALVASIMYLILK